MKKDGYIVDASKVMTFKAGKNIGLVQKPGEFSISTIDTPSFKSVELRGETKEVDGSQVTPVTMMDSSGMQVYTETVTPGDAGTTTTKKVSTTVNNEGVTTDGTVKVTNGEDGGKDLVSLGKGSATTGETDQDFGTIHVDGKQGADGTITIDRGTKSLTDTANVGKDREQKIDANNPVAGMDRITYTTKGPNDSTINHEVATLDDGFFLTTSKDVADKKAAAGVKLNDTIQFNDGINTKVSTVTSERGVHELHIDVSGLPVSYTDNDGDAVTKIGDKYYKSNQVVDGKPIDGATEVPADKVTNNVKVVNKDGGTTEQGSIGNVKSVFDSTIGNGGDTGSQIDDINDANKVEKVPGTNKFIKDLTTLKGDTPADKEKLNSVSTVGDLQKVALTPLFFEGDTAESATTKNAFGRKLSEKAKILGGQKDVTKLTDNNIGVVSNGSDTLTIKLAKELKDLDSVKVSNGKDGDDAKDLVTIGKEVNSDAAPGTDGENGTIGLNGKNGSEAVITIDRGTKSMNDKVNLGTDPNQDISGTNTAANMDRITYTTKGPNDSTINHEVATLDDGFFLTTSKDVTDNKAAAKVKLNNTIKFTDGANTKVSTVESKDGVHELHIDVNGLPVVYTDKDGNKLTKVGDKFYKDDQFDNGTLKPNATPSDAKNISIVNPDGSISKTDGSVPTTVNNVGSSIGGDVNNGAPKGSTINGEPGNNSFIDNLNKVGGTGDDAISKNAVVTTGDLKNLADTPLFFSGDVADGKDGNGKNTFGRKLSEEAKIVGGVTTPANLTDNNIGVVSNGSDTLTIKLAKQLTGLDSATYTSPTTKTDDGDATSTMKVDGNGIRFVGDNNAVKTDAPSLTTDGITGGNKQITNVGSGFKNGTTSVTIDDIKNPSDALKDSNVWNNAVNVGDLKNIIDTGFKLNTSGQPTKSGATTVKIGDTINIIDGANTKVSAIDDSTTGTHTFHIDVNGLPMSYVDGDGNPLTKIGDKFYKTSDLVNGVPPAGTAEVPADKVTSNVSMLDNTGSHTGVAPQIKNVGSGLVDNNGKTIKPNELLNMTDANNPVLKNAVNVGDLKQVAAAAKTEVTGTGEAFVTDTEEEDGHIIYNVHVDKILAHKDAAGNELVRGGDGKYYTNEAIKDKTYIPSENKWYSNSDLTNGKPNKDAQAVTPDPVDQSNIKTSLVNPNTGVGDGTDTSMTLDNVKSGIGGDAGNGIKDGATVDGTQGDNTFIKNLDNVGGTGKDAIDKTTVVNAGDLKNLAETPLFFSGDVADGKDYNGATNTKNTFGRKLSEEAKIVGGVTTLANLTDNNIGVVSNGSDTLTIKLAKELQDLTSVTTVDETDGTKTIVSGKGVTTDGKVVVNNGKTGDEAKEFVTIDKGTDGSGTDKEYGKIGLDGKNGSNATITIDRGTKSLNDDVNIGVDPSQPVSETNKSATMDRITYTTTGPNKTVINHEVATLDDGFFLTTSKDVTDDKAAAKVKLNNTIKFTDGANTKVSTVDSKKGIHELHIDVTGLPVTYTASELDNNSKPTNTQNVSKVGDTYQLEDGTKLVKVDGKYYKPDQLENGKPKPDEEGLIIKESVSLTQDNSAPATLERVGSGRRNGMKANADPMAWDKILNPSAEDKAKVDNMLTNAANIGDVRDAIKSITDGTSSDNASGGFGLTGNNGDVKQDLGKTITVKGGIANKVDDHVPAKSTTDQNTYVNVKDVPNADGNGTHKEMVVEIAKDLTDLDSVTVGNVDESGNGGTVINKDGMTVKDATGNNSTSIGTGTIGTSKTDKDGNTSSTNIDGGTITSEKKDKDGNKQSTTIDGSHMTLENKDKDDKLTGPKTEVSNKGITITPVDEDGKPIEGKKVELSDTGLNNGGNQIINVDSGLKDKNGSVKLKDATGDVLNHAVNVGDLKEAINNAQTAVDGDGAAEISKSVDDNGRPTYKVHVDKLVEAKADDGKAIVRGEDNKFYYKDERLKQGKDGKWYMKDELDADGNPKAGAVGKNIPILGTKPVPADRLKTSLVNPNDPNSKVKLDNIKSAIGGKVNGADGTNSFIDNLDNVGKEGGIGNDAAVTTGDLKNLADTPLFFGGDSADGKSTDGKEHTNTFDRKLGKQINIKGEVDLGLDDNATAGEREAAIKKKLSDGNIGVISNGKDTLTVKLSKDLKDLNTIEVNDSVSVGKDGDSTVIKGDSLTASSKDENGHDKVTNISSDGFNSTAITFERDGNGQIVRNPDTGLPKEVTNSTNINSDGFTATRKDSEGNEVLKTTMQNGNIAIEKPQPIIDPTTGEAYKVLDKDGNWVPAHGYTKISDNGFEIQGINQSGTGISKVRLSSEGLDNGGNRITHVAEGVAPDDAVNVSQLRGLAQNINNDIANVGANAAALAGLKAIQYDPLEPTQIMAAVGTYRGKQAAALGIAHYKNEDTMFHMGVSIGSDHTMANIGVTYKFGRTDEKKAVPDRYKAGPISSTYVLQDEMVALKEENARMRANDEKMNAAYDEILDLVKQLKQDNEEMKKKLEKLEKK